MRFSNYLLKIPVDGDQLLLVGLVLRSAIVVDRSSFESVEARLRSTERPSSEIDPLLTHLRETLMVVDDHADELEDISRRSISARALNDTFSAVLIPTMSCNLRCSYCFQNHKQHAANPLPMNLPAVMDYLKSRLTGKNYSSFHVRWFGGEPLLAMDSIRLFSRDALRMCSDLALSYSSDVVSNGSQIDADLAEELMNLGVSDVQITFDGNRGHHDRIRTGPRDKNTYDRLIDSIASASQFLGIRARIHVAPYNLESIDELLRDLASRDLQSVLKSIYFAPLFNYRQSAKDNAFERQDALFMTSMDFAKVQIELHRKALSLGFRLSDPLDSDYGVCTALREDTVVINDDGTLTKCYMDAGDTDESFGNVWNGTTRDSKLSIWRSHSFADDAECATCQMAPVCLGGCAKQSQGGADKSIVCTPLKYNYRELLPLHLLNEGSN